MKTLVATVKNPADGDLVVVEYSSPRGGCTSVKHRIVGARTKPVLDADGFVTSTEAIPAQTPADIAGVLAGLIKNEWMPEAFQAKESNGNLVIYCTGLVENVIFRASVAGEGGTAVEIMEL